MSAKIKLLLALIFSFSVLFLGACNPVFLNPITESGSASEKQLAGDWFVFKDGVLKDQLHVSPGENGWLKVVYVHDINQNRNERLNLIVFDGYISKIASGNYFNMRITGEKRSVFIPIKYELKDDKTLIAKLPSLDKIKTLIEDKVLEGKLSEKGVFSDRAVTVVTSDSKKLEKVFNELDNKIYETSDFSYFCFKRE